VLLFTVESGGHTWPGGPQYAPEFLIGRVSKDLHTGKVLWEFFDAADS
jgi:polyhydroxybutyrate depolymerase